MPSGGPCPAHCPDTGGGWLLAVAVVAVAAGVAVVADWVWSELPLLAVAAVAFAVPMVSWCVWMAVHYRGTPPWETTAEERVALPARVPLAIEAAKPVLTLVPVARQEARR